MDASEPRTGRSAWVVWLLLLGVGAPSPAAAEVAEVSMKNGNFYVAYTDYIYAPGGRDEFRIERTYNSKTIAQGWFGLGWGSKYETRLYVIGDGTVIIKENGSWAITVFRPPLINRSRLADRVHTIVAAMTPRERERLETRASPRRDARQQLLTDAERRRVWDLELTGRGHIPPAVIAPGERLVSTDQQRLFVNPDGFRRMYPNGETERFDVDGRLVEVRDKAGFVISLMYQAGQVDRIETSRGARLDFEFGPDRLLRRLSSGGRTVSTYSYGRRRLISSTDADGNRYRHTYDDNYSMVGIFYEDGSRVDISYQPKTQFVAASRDRDGTSSYVYGGDSDLHYWTDVTHHIKGRAPITNRKEYWIGVAPDGSKFTERIRTRHNGIETDTEYSPCGLPSAISQGKHKTRFEYNARCLLVYKAECDRDSCSVTELDYDSRFNKISLLKKYRSDPSGTPTSDDPEWVRFEYNVLGDLARAWNSSGGTVALVYDEKAQIREIREIRESELVLEIKYNALGLPSQVHLVGVGSIDVKYDDYGGIVFGSAEATEVTLMVIQAFQNLLSLVRLAGVSVPPR